MFLIFLAIWIIFNAKLDLEILLFGLAIAAALFAFACKFMDYSVQKELHLYKKLPGMIRYVCALVKEILVANLNVCHMIISQEEEVEPALAEFTGHMRTPAGRALYANAITLTPGTITVTLEDDRYVVHCLDESLADGLADSGLERMLLDLEG